MQSQPSVSMFQPMPFEQEQQQQQQPTSKRIFVSQPESNSFSIVELKGDSQYHWELFLQEVRRMMNLPKSSNLKITLAEVNARITAASQLHSNDKIIIDWA